jgi:hypothetical protein
VSCYCGARPGGRGKFAVCLFVEDGPRKRLRSALVADTAAALRWLEFALDGQPLEALGVVAPLSWSPDHGHWRALDRYLRRTYPELASRLISPASRRGATVIAGPLLVNELRRRQTELTVTEVQPLPVMQALADLGRDIPVLETANPNPYLSDAEVAAYCAFAAHTGRDGWLDLYRVVDEDRRLQYPCGSVGCHFPTLREDR